MSLRLPDPDPSGDQWRDAGHYLTLGGAAPRLHNRPQIVFSPILATDLIRDYPELRKPVIEGVLRRGETMNLVAAPKTGKTWLVHALAVAVSRGRPWLGHPTGVGRVLLIDAELHKPTLARRLASTVRAMGISPDEPSGQLVTWPVRGHGLTINDLGELLRNVAKSEYRLIVLDALYRFLPLDGEENSNATMTRVYNTIDVLAEHLDAAFVLVHHTTKGGQASKSVTDVGAGGGAQSRAADTHLILRPHEQEGAVVDPELAAVIAAWPGVPAAIRAGIMAMVTAVAPPAGERRKR